MKMPGAAADALRKLIEETEDHGEGAPRREIARATHGYPVYADLSGGLAVTPDGRVLQYAWESREVREANEWERKTALERFAAELPGIAKNFR